VAGGPGLTNRPVDLDAAIARGRQSDAHIVGAINKVVAAGDRMDPFVALYAASAGARAKGLHGAIMREMGRDNPHAVYALIGALVDLVLVTMEVRRNPSYAEVVAHDPASSAIGRKRKSPQAPVSAAIREVPDMKDAWALLSEMGRHFGWAAFKTPMVIQDLPSSRTVTVNTGPGWNDPAMKGSSLRHLADLTDSMAGMLMEMSERPEFRRKASGT
jgi:hypothetical protein